MFYKEWARTVHSRSGRMVSMDSLPILLKLKDPGYASVYMFNEADASQIKHAGHSRGLSNYEVSAYHLILDIDNGEEGLSLAEKALTSRGLKYSVWSSGGKGFHVYIPHKLVTSVDLPHSHAKVVEGLGLAVDNTLYQHGRLISLPGRVHPKTKNRKTLIKTVEGSPIDIPIHKKPQMVFDFEDGGGAGELTAALLRVVGIAEAEPSEGNRHTALWGASKDLSDAGLSFQTVLDIMHGVNDQWKRPKAQEEVELAVVQAFNGRLKKN